jgi:NMD protein affecting ribosome stability and mRNA decay
MEINKVSNPDKVKVNLEKYYGKDVEIYLSTRKGKKYMIVSPDGKKIHFGDINFSDYTKHLDAKRRQSFRNRNWKWKDAKPYTPSHLSYYLLW